MATKIAYPLKRTWKAASRQHYLLNQYLGGHLLDPIIQKSSSDLVIGDICCGTGIWLMSLAGQLPASAELHALDISFDQFLHSSWEPQNVQRHTYNIFNPPPDDLVARFDIINVSITVSFVNDQMIDKVLANVAAFLKPGGYLQWQEIDPGLAVYPQSDPSIPLKYVDKVGPCASKCIDLDPPRWVSKLEMKMEEAGLEVVSSVRPSFDPKLLHISTQLGLLGLEEFIEGMEQRAGLDPAMKERLDECGETLMKAWDEHQETGGSIWVPVVRTVGQKRQQSF